MASRKPPCGPFRRLYRERADLWTRLTQGKFHLVETPTELPLPREPQWWNLLGGGFELREPTHLATLHSFSLTKPINYSRFLLNTRNTIVIELQSAGPFAREVLVVDDCLSKPVETRFVIPIPIYECLRQNRDQLIFLGTFNIFNYTISTKTLARVPYCALSASPCCWRVSVFEETIALFQGWSELRVLDLDSGARRIVTPPPNFPQGSIVALDDGTLGLVVVGSLLVGHVVFDP